MDSDEIARRVDRAWRSFLDNERDLLEVGVNERSLTHKLAEHLQTVFDGWHVDCEYNRFGQCTKKLPRPKQSSTDDTEGRSIFPDIVVHKRKSQRENNLLVVEVKKATNNRNGDEEKLKAMTGSEFGYILGLHLTIDCEQRCLTKVAAYANRELDAEMTDRLAASFDVRERP